jgi:uncharacterized Tic20 family protein
MRGLKIAGLIILSFVLFISLIAFGLAFSLNRTALNPDFVTAEGDRLEIAPLASEAMSQMLPVGLSEEALGSLTETITTLEPRLKDELNTIVYSVYEYLHGERANPELANLLGLTFLSSDFIVAVIDTIDGPQLARIIWEEFEEEIAQESSLPEEAFPHLVAGFGELLTDLKPWIKEQVEYAAGPIADYLTGEVESFNVTISLEPLIDGLRGMLLGVFLDFPPDELEGLPPEELEEAFDAFWAEFAGEVLPTTFQIDETVIGKDAPLQIASFTSEAETILRQAREYVDYVRLAYILSIVVSVLLIAGIVLIYRNVKGSTRTLGIVFLASGLVVLAMALVGKNVGGVQMLQAMLAAPPQLQVWASQLLVDLLAPLQWLGIGFIASGITLLVVSFVYRSNRTTD